MATKTQEDTGESQLLTLCMVQCDTTPHTCILTQHTDTHTLKNLMPTEEEQVIDQEQQTQKYDNLVIRHIEYHVHLCEKGISPLGVYS